MVSRLAYPDAPPSKLYEIYRQSLRQPIHAYGFYVDPAQLYHKKRDRCQPNRPLAKDLSLFMWETRQELLDTGLHKLAVTIVPSPKQYRTISSTQGWLIILGTGFDKTPHVPISDELTQRVRGIIETDEPPTWWSLRSYEYAHPKIWIEDRAKIEAAQQKQLEL
ncbi:hypothetical protein RSOLAG22IIIB_06090 [Rhizoctonia solani]|uniref:Uncharacterized protein n=1 Tax=Rhizoctonia solani TaxID=456999 RepID=A0A0K6GBQ2_9AGAM|nr:hypothetical protein RSOLAG22IIIB_06090 [Rhizoctonia solani]